MTGKITQSDKKIGVLPNERHFFLVKNTTPCSFCIHLKSTKAKDPAALGAVGPLAMGSSALGQMKFKLCLAQHKAVSFQKGPAAHIHPAAVGQQPSAALAAGCRGQVDQQRPAHTLFPLGGADIQLHHRAGEAVSARV